MQRKSIKRTLRRIDGRGYKAYKELVGAEESIRGVRVSVTRVQGDPFAPPSMVEVKGVISDLGDLLKWSIPLSDFLLRILYRELKKRSTKEGEGRSGYLGVPRPSNIIIRRSSLELEKNGEFTARVWVGLPSRRRRINAGAAEEMLLRRIPEAFRAALTELRSQKEKAEEHVRTWRMQEFIRSMLPEKGLVSFVGNGAILPRRCGGCEDPLPDAVPFESPSSLEVSFTLPWGEEIRGMGIRRGVTVIAGAAFHGKTTLAQAIAAGVWNHIPGDGREKVVTIREAMCVSTEEGRFIASVDVSPLIHNLPRGPDTTCFTTTSASGATSVAAGVQEAVEAGAKLLILDEDLVATNILYSDDRAASITSRSTVTPIFQVAKSMSEKGVSLIIVSAGNLPMLAAADTVIVMEDYKPTDRTSVAANLVKKYGLHVKHSKYMLPKDRVLVRMPEMKKPKIRGLRLEDKLLEAPVDIKYNQQLVEETQLNTLLALLMFTKRRGIGKTMKNIAKEIDELMKKGFNSIAGKRIGPGLGEIRGLDLIYLLNRLPGIVVRQVSS